jgi:hypothetical protein
MVSSDDDGMIYLPDYMSGAEIDIFVSMCGGEPDLVTDPILQARFHTAFFDGDVTPRQRDKAYKSLKSYVRRAYGQDFDNEMDWEAYRTWYG